MENSENKPKENVGWKISAEIIERFKNYCDSDSRGYGESMAAAFIIWTYLPPTVQKQAIQEAKGIPSVDSQFWSEFAKGLEDAVLSQVRNLADKKGRG